jgi:hypothetical protein
LADQFGWSPMRNRILDQGVSSAPLPSKRKSGQLTNAGLYMAFQNISNII